ncbi:MAG: SulP family inorganic anion transporter [Chloracidobacterium sp.]|uniref:SulP family inorganic anion transporter n=1 Tax=Chloracidobacterium validum TaxID=2821543 RepID=A0ABX8B8F7_9BACT|nr:SulP family inorganic anion transporter [Chloracidobacterium validum]QUW01900.1 SulP family inorganic anion transporter [Chloracidobacterium validum]
MPIDLATPHRLEPGVIANLRYDFPAGVVVFLVALPLCLGIALASNAPLFSGIIAGIIGGLVIAPLSGSQLSVSGPAAGLAVIVAQGIVTAGDFRAFLAAVVVAGALQIVFGLMRGGALADYIPNCVIKGMLAGIGIVIILKQIPHALGRDQDFTFTDTLSFLKFEESSTVGAIITGILSAQPAAVAITIVSLLVLLTWDHPKLKQLPWLTLLPGPLVVVILGVLINEVLRVSGSAFYLRADEAHLVTLPVATGFTSFLSQLTLPDIEALRRPEILKLGATLAVIASLETLLSVEAADKMDPFKRLSKPNQELFAQGIGNILSGLIGGLPITAVIVRTTANVYAGGRTRLSGFIHGVLLLFAVVLVPDLLNRIPIASLAAILLLVGYKLAQPSLFQSMYAQGYAQFAPFIVTVVAIVATDLLVGIGIGLIFGLFFVIRANYRSAVTLVSHGDAYLLRFNKDVTFVNKTELKRKLQSIPDGAILFIDGTRALYVDQDIFDVINEFRAASAYRNITVSTSNFDEKAPSLIQPQPAH